MLNVHLNVNNHQVEAYLNTSNHKNTYNIMIQFLLSTHLLGKL